MSAPMAHKPRPIQLRYSRGKRYRAIVLTKGKGESTRHMPPATMQPRKMLSCLAASGLRRTNAERGRGAGPRSSSGNWLGPGSGGRGAA